MPIQSGSALPEAVRAEALRRLADWAADAFGSLDAARPERQASAAASAWALRRPIEPAVLELLARAKLARSVRIVNGLVPGNLTRALNGEPVGSLIRA